MSLSITVLSGRAYIRVDLSGMYWRGPARRHDIEWSAVDHVIVDER
jgi:hypothetical protein